MTDGSEIPDAARVREIDRRIEGESERHDDCNDRFRAALRPLYPFFDRQDSDEANLRMRQTPDWAPLEATREAAPPDCPAA